MKADWRSRRVSSLTLFQSALMSLLQTERMNELLSSVVVTPRKMESNPVVFETWAPTIIAYYLSYNPTLSVSTYVALWIFCLSVLLVALSLFTECNFSVRIGFCTVSVTDFFISVDVVMILFS